MSNRLTIIAVIVLIIILAVAGYFYYSLLPKDQNQQETNVVENIVNLFPFGQDTGVDGRMPSDSDQDQDDSSQTFGPQLLPKLRKISNSAIAGFDFLRLKENQNQGTSTRQIVTARYVERATGHVFEAQLAEKDLNRISNTTIPKVYQAYFLNKGDSVVLRFLDEDNLTIKTYLGGLEEVTEVSTSTKDFEEYTLKGSFLSDNLSEVAVRIDRNDFLYSINTGGGSEIIQKSADGSEATLLSSPISEWLLDWRTNGQVILTTKPDNSKNGYTYSWISGSFNRELGPLNGLTTKQSPDGEKLLVSANDQSSRSYVYDLQKESLTSLDWTAIPEKCVWEENDAQIIYCAIPKDFQENSYPRFWYQGLAQYDDALWKINLETGNRQQLIDPNEEGVSIDVESIKIDDKSRYLLFKNKKDLNLWSYRLVD